jgi:hypothetical protein
MHVGPSGASVARNERACRITFASATVTSVHGFGTAAVGDGVTVVCVFDCRGGVYA